jgi:hypothetical protein
MKVALGLVELTFLAETLVAGRLADSLFHRAFRVISGALYMFLVHFPTPLN